MFHLLMDFQAVLLSSPKLLLLRPSQLFYPDLGLLKLVAWPPCGDASCQTEFFQKLQTWSWPHGA